MVKFKSGYKVKIPKTKSRLSEGMLWYNFREELNPDWKYLLIDDNLGEEYDIYKIGVAGPNKEYIGHNSFYESDLELYEEPKDLISCQTPTNESAWNTQIAGNHYKDMVIQPMEYSMKNNLNPLQHTIIKYVSRYKDKNGVEDLKKAIHCCNLLIEWELKK